MTNPKDLAVEKAGSISELARICGVSRQAAQKWERIPIDHVKHVSAVLRIPIEDLVQ